MIEKKASYSELLKATNYRFKPGEQIVPKEVIGYPESPEREYRRLMRDYMGIVKEEFQKQLPALKELYKTERKEMMKMRTDAETDLLTQMTDIFNQVFNGVNERTDMFGLADRLWKIALLTNRLSTKRWKRLVFSALGIDIREDYYLGDYFREHLAEWVDYNVGLIVTVPQTILGQMRDITLSAYSSGLSTKDLAKKINNVYGIGARRSKFWARDQMAKLYSSIARTQQTDAGVTYYKWDTSGDQRVRDSHRELDGQYFRWDRPPLNGDGRRCHPGEDFQCRCVAMPVLAIDEVSLPILTKPYDY